METRRGSKKSPRRHENIVFANSSILLLDDGACKNTAAARKWLQEGQHGRARRGEERQGTPQQLIPTSAASLRELN